MQELAGQMPQLSKTLIWLFPQEIKGSCWGKLPSGDHTTTSRGYASTNYLGPYKVHTTYLLCYYGVAFRVPGFFEIHSISDSWTPERQLPGLLDGIEADMVLTLIIRKMRALSRVLEHFGVQNSGLRAVLRGPGDLIHSDKQGPKSALSQF